jgi:hypothetical protein
MECMAGRRVTQRGVRTGTSDTVTCAGARKQMSEESLINYGGGGEI